MSVNAAIFDVYATLLEVGLPPGDADDRWQRLCQEFLQAAPPLARSEFAIATGRVISRLHAEARARGIPWPEIQWPSVVREVIPQLQTLASDQQAEFIFRQMQLGRSLRLADGAVECLRYLRERGCLLGIISNSQAYTLRELTDALAPVGADLFWFENDLQFWSFENGFSKPDPHAFRIISARLEQRGIAPAQTLMVGDRLDNDIHPARAQGWQAWQLLRQTGPAMSGTWSDLHTWLE